MTTLADKIAFSKLLTLADGTPFSLEGRPWVVDEFWRPADGWKLWPRKDHEPCQTCAALATTIIEHPDDNPTAQCACGGIDAHPIIVTMIDLERQDGKTTAVAGYSLATIFTGRNKHIDFLCTSEDQGEMLLRENYAEVVRANKDLERRSEIYRLRIIVPQMKSFIEAIPCGAKRATGSARTHVLVDEARDIGADIFVREVNKIKARSGFECPRGHVQISPEAVEKMAAAPMHCSVCGLRLTAWYPRIIVASSSGILTDDVERDWFPNTIVKRSAKPVSYCHVFSSQVPLNPRKDPTVTNAIDVTFGDIPGLEDHVIAEGHNVAMRKGDEAVSLKGVERCTDKSLVSLAECGDECVGFLDTSLSHDKTSLVILARDAIKSGEKAWHRVYVAHLHWWTPADSGGVIDENAIYDYCNALLPRFSGLRMLAIDVAFSPWARRFVARAKASKLSWGRRIQPWENQKHQSRAGRADLQQRISDVRIRLPDCDEMRAEFRGIKAAPPGDLNVWKDRSPKKKHADIIESLACCCYLAAMEEMSGGCFRLRMTDKEKMTATQRVLNAMDGVSVGGQRFGSDSY